MPDHGFEQNFKTLTGHEPFPWQTRLYERMIDEAGSEPTPASAHLPTGLGKTSVIAVWLLAWLKRPGRIPRRLAYVVNRRTVVDQTTREVERLRDNIPKLNHPTCKSIAISTLRGQAADNGAWSADPSRPAVICGTVDMIGSRLLFSGYRAGFKSRPMQAGLLGQDTLLIHDEAHLEPAFQELIESITQEQQRERDADGSAINTLPWQGLRVMALSATTRKSTGAPFTLDDQDKAHAIVQQRLHASKALMLRRVDEKQLVKELADRGEKLVAEGAPAVLIFARQVNTVDGVVKALQKSGHHVRVLLGPMRGHERERMAKESGVFARFLPDSDRPPGVELVEGPAFLVCTAAGEVGVNLSADHLICDLSPLDSMIQRLGRVNRFGDRQDTRVEVLAPKTFDDKPPNPERERTFQWLEQLASDASPIALGALADREKDLTKKAFTPKPAILPVSDILFDAWAMTSLQPPRVEALPPGCPPVEPYLHGVAEWDPPQTQVAWREDVRWYNDLHEPPTPEQMLADYPLKPHEILTDRSERVAETVLKRFKRLKDDEAPAAWIVDEQGRVEVTSLEKLGELDKKALAQRLAHKALLLGPDTGMLSRDGRLDDSPPEDRPQDTGYDVADFWFDQEGNRARWRGTPDGEDAPAARRGMRLIRRIEIDTAPAADGDDTGPPTTWDWYARPRSADDDGSQAAGSEQELPDHLRAAEAFATTYVAQLGMGETEATAVTLAAAWHDLGKDRDLWQRAIFNHDYPERVLAKSGNRMMPTQLSAYRHEFGSALDVLHGPEAERYEALPEPTRDLLLHLIAAHHGRARPHFTEAEAYDPLPEYGDAARTLALETPRRFARLQRRYGRWGLALLESLVRAADYAASAAISPDASAGDEPRQTEVTHA